MDYFDCIFISTEDLAYCFLTGFISSISCSTCSKRNLMGTSVRNGQEFFILFGRRYYFIQQLKFPYYNNIFGNDFQTSGVIDLITLLYARLRYYKIFQLLEKVFLVWHFIENQVFTIFALFPCFSVFSLLKLMQLVCLVVCWCSLKRSR